MEEEQIAWDLQHAPSLKLLKAHHAPLILSFLHQQFKKAQRVSIELPELIEALEGYLESLNEQNPTRYPGTAQSYIHQWADNDHSFIRIIPGNNEVPLVALTSDAERAIGWIEDIHTRPFIGTESRFHLIIQLINDIVQGSTDDPTQRLAQLEQQRQEIDRQIETIRQTGRVDSRMTSTQLRERFLEASNLARQLLRDFKLVEDRFRDIARSIQQAQLQPGTRKGHLVEYVLDANQELKLSDQGRSFYAFWDFLMAPSQNEELKTLLEQLNQLPDIRSTLENDQLLPRLPGYLITAGENVVRSNARLAEQLRRLLDEQAALTNRRVLELVQDIKQAIYQQEEIIFSDEVFLEISDVPELYSAMERPLYEETKTTYFHEQPRLVDEQEQEQIDFTALYNQFSIDETRIRQRIETFLEQRPVVHLSEIVDRYPIEQGLSEIIAYCVIAAENTRHTIDISQYEEIRFLSSTPENLPQERTILLPHIRYRRYSHEE